MSDFSKRVANLSPAKRALLARRMSSKLEAISGSPSPLVCLQERGSGTPFFCVHPSGGTVLCYSDLARRLGPERPFYGLQALGLSEERALHTVIEEMASAYVEALREVQPKGPYLLGGWSMGALVAYEMAQQLTAQRQRVGLLALLDMAVLTPEDVLEVDEALILYGFLGSRLPLCVDQLRQLDATAQLTYVLEEAKKANVLPPEFGLAQARSIVNVCKANDTAAQRYLPRPYPGKVTLLRATQQRHAIFGQVLNSTDETMGWGALAEGGVSVHPVPGDHDSMIMKPHVEVLSEVLRACIGRALASERPSERG